MMILPPKEKSPSPFRTKEKDSPSGVTLKESAKKPHPPPLANYIKDMFDNGNMVNRNKQPDLPPLDAKGRESTKSVKNQQVRSNLLSAKNAYLGGSIPKPQLQGEHIMPLVIQNTGSSAMTSRNVIGRNHSQSINHTRKDPSPLSQGKSERSLHSKQ